MLKALKLSLLSAAIGISIAMPANAEDISPTDVIGEWVTHTGGRAAFQTCEDTVCGTLEWELRWAETGVIPVDEKNPDKSLRSRSFKGLTILYGFRETKKGWRKGKFYDPWSGKTIAANLKRVDAETLRLSGCLALFLCKSFDWTLAEEPLTLSEATSSSR